MFAGRDQFWVLLSNVTFRGIDVGYVVVDSIRQKLKDFNKLDDGGDGL